MITDGRTCYLPPTCALRKKVNSIVCLLVPLYWTEGFGLTALEALSAGLPILVSGNSGFGDALRTVPPGKSFVVDSEDPKVWAEAIAVVRKKERSQRLKEVERLRTSYEGQFSWEKQCDLLVDKMRVKVHGAGMLMIFMFLSLDLSFLVVSQIYSVLDVNKFWTSKRGF